MLYVTAVEDTNHVVDTIWVGTAEVDEIYTIRANPWLSLSDTSVCMIHYADMQLILMSMMLRQSSGVTVLIMRLLIYNNYTYGLLTDYSGTYEMGGNVEYEEARFADFDKTFDTLHLIVSLTTGNPTCPIAYDTALLTLMSAHTLILQTPGISVQNICYNDDYSYKYIFGNGPDSVEVTWDIIRQL